jgi:putative ABC transport system permease protein
LIASAITGVAFGMLPAMRASRLDPVEALRHE